MQLQPGVNGERKGGLSPLNVPVAHRFHETCIKQTGEEKVEGGEQGGRGGGRGRASSFGRCKEKREVKSRS